MYILVAVFAALLSRSSFAIVISAECSASFVDFGIYHILVAKRAQPGVQRYRDTI